MNKTLLKDIGLGWFVGVVVFAYFMLLLAFAGYALLVDALRPISGDPSLQSAKLWASVAWLATPVWLVVGLASLVPDRIWWIVAVVILGLAIIKEVERGQQLRAARHAEILTRLREIQEALAPLAAREREKETMREIRASMKRHAEAVRLHGHEQALRPRIEAEPRADGEQHDPNI